MPQLEPDARGIFLSQLKVTQYYLPWNFLLRNKNTAGYVPFVPGNAIGLLSVLAGDMDCNKKTKMVQVPFLWHCSMSAEKQSPQLRSSRSSKYFLEKAERQAL